MIFKDRHEAGVKLAAYLEKYRERPQTVVVGLARGGVVVAHAVAQKLNLPLDVMVIRKLGAPMQEELAIGAIDEEGHLFVNEPLIQSLGVSPAYLAEESDRQKKLAQYRAALYRKNRKKVDLYEKTVIVVDDGLATGASMRAAIYSLRLKGVGKIVLAVPVAASDALKSLSKEVQETVCITTPENFMAVGQFYQKFDQTSDDEVVQLLG